MNIDTLLRIYQTYSFEEISALNQRGLAMQHAQCEQLVKLRKELGANAAATNPILWNQIKELERQETVTYYKNLISNLRLAVEKIDNNPIEVLKLFLSSIFLLPIRAYAGESMHHLEEISDKEYALQIIESVNQLYISHKHLEAEYLRTAWGQYFLQKEALENNVLKIKKREQRLNVLQLKIGVDNEIDKTQIERLNTEIKQLASEEQKLNDEFNSTVNSMNKECPDWVKQVTEIMMLLPHNIPDEKSTKQLDPLLREAALLIVAHQQGSTSLLRHQFNIGYNRAGRIMEQLEDLNIVGEACGSEPREVWCKSEEEVEYILQKVEG